MSEGVYGVTELVGTSTESWEKADDGGHRSEH
jgi:flavin-binding protein dodecin